MLIISTSVDPSVVDKASNLMKLLQEKIKTKFQGVKLMVESSPITSDDDEIDDSNTLPYDSPIRPKVKISKKHRQQKVLSDSYGLFLKELQKFEAFLTTIEGEMGTRVFTEKLPTDDAEINKEIAKLQVSSFV